MNSRSPLRAFALSALGLILGSAAGCSWTGPVLVVHKVEEVLRPNRKLEVNSMWRGAKPLTIQLASPAGAGPAGSAAPAVTLRAVHDGRAISFWASWPDRTESGERVLWVWREDSRAYFRIQQPTDFFALKFPMTGSEAACMMTGDTGVFDVWQWRGGWSHLSGFADDRTLTISATPPESGEASAYPLHGGSAVFVSWKDDEGRPPLAPLPMPKGKRRPEMPGMVAQEPSGSASDVLAEEIYQEGVWNVEFHRLLNTGNPDDREIERKRRGLRFSVAAGDGREGAAHYTSGLIRLVLE